MEHSPQTHHDNKKTVGQKADEVLAWIKRSVQNVTKILGDRYKRYIAPSIVRPWARVTLSVVFSAISAGVAAFIVMQGSTDNYGESARAGVAEMLVGHRPHGGNYGVETQKKNGKLKSISPPPKRDWKTLTEKYSVPTAVPHKPAVYQQHTGQYGKRNASFTGTLGNQRYTPDRRNTSNRRYTSGPQVVTPERQHIGPRGNIKRLRLIRNKAETIRIESSYSTALVSNEEIADIVALTDKLIHVVGKKIGTTRLTILDNDKKVRNLIEIEVTYDLKKISRTLRQLIPGSRIRVESLNGKVLLTGVVPDAPAIERAIAFTQDLSEGNVTSALKVADPQQVMLEVRFVEANRQAAKDFGIGWNVIANNFIASTLNPGKAIQTMLSGQSAYGAFAGSFNHKGASIDVMIKMLQSKNLARTLAEPNLTALSGEKANFIAGGEFPFSVAGRDGVVTTQFRKYGISLDFTPTVLDNGLINLKIEPEVSELGPSLVELAPGVKAPIIHVRRVKTTVELRSGQSFAIAGLLQTTNYRIRNQLPVLGDLPILGTLFKSSSFQKKETDLVIIVTPHIAQPIAPGTRIHEPGSRTALTTPAESILIGNDERAIQDIISDKDPNKKQVKAGHFFPKMTKTEKDADLQGQVPTTGNGSKSVSTVQKRDPIDERAQNTEITTSGRVALEKYNKFQKKKDGTTNEKVKDLDDRPTAKDVFEIRN